MSLRSPLFVVFALVGCASEAQGDGSSSGESTSTSPATSDGSGSGIVTVTNGDPSVTGSADSSGGGSSGGSVTGDPDEDSGSESTTGAPIECPDDAFAAGQYNDLAIEHDGIARTYNLYVPAGIDGSEPIPLVMNFHGYLSNPGQQQAFSVMDPVADAHGFAVAYPAGLNSSWNAGACCGQSASDGVDDVGFALAVIEDVKSRACIDAKRVYSTGMSNGGFLSYRLACEAADSIAAIAPVAGVLGIAEMDCAPSRPVPIMHFHGTSDGLVPYAGGLGFASVAATIEIWTGLDGCVDEPTEIFAEADVSCVASELCDDDSRIELCTVAGAGHCWPGNAFCPFGTSTTTIDASERMAEFFAGYTLP